MNTIQRPIVAQFISVSLLAFAILWLGASAGQAVAVPTSNPAGRLIAEDPPADDGASSNSGADGAADGSDNPDGGATDPATEEPQPEPSASEAPASPVDTDGSSQSNQNDSKGDRDRNSSQSDEESSADKSRVPAVPTGAASPEPTETPQPRMALVTEHGPSPLGWVLLAAGLVFALAAAVFYLRKRPFDDIEGSEIVETPLESEGLGLVDPHGAFAGAALDEAVVAADASGLVNESGLGEGPGVVGEPDVLDAPPGVGSTDADTEELEAAPAGGLDAHGPDTEEMHIVPLGVDVAPTPVMEPEAPKR